ncbi:MAG: hypothetical protein A2Y91_08425 [Chloroflexi bacterium RBG_13_54_8]|nr:MAG: hypothetical protein A2Y91_08425 [Chloroflexi bacterium RBG_13_54_8]
MASPFYNDDLPVVHQFLEAYAIYRPEVTYKHLTEGDTGPLGGWATAMFIVDALKRVVEAEGASNVTGESLAEALGATNMTVEGFSPDNTWRFPEEYHSAIRAYKTFEYKTAEGEWKSISGWFVPPSLEPYQ